MVSEPPSDVWVFGYGSLIFRAEFACAERRVARLPGFERRFWQSSPDHRGTPATPGRVVTLVENPAAAVLGVAYRLRAAQAEQILAELDERERAGYVRTSVCVEFTEAPFGGAYALTYQARADNPGFMAHESDQQIAEIVRVARGPSGDNASYVIRLAQALRELGEDDLHVSTITRLLAEKP